MKCISICVFCLLLFLSPASAQWIVEDPANLVENAATALSTANSLLEEIKQVEMEIENLKKYADGSWQDLVPLLEELHSKVRDGQALAYSMKNLDGTFKKKYPGYVTVKDWSKVYNDWTATTLDTLRGALNSANIQSVDITDEQSFISALEVLSDTAVGRDQVMQAGNMIASAQVKQLMKLRELMMTQINSQNVYMANQVNEAAQVNAKLKEWLGPEKIEIPTYKAGDPRGVGRLGR